MASAKPASRGGKHCHVVNSNKAPAPPDARNSSLTKTAMEATVRAAEGSSAFSHSGTNLSPLASPIAMEVDGGDESIMDAIPEGKERIFLV